MCIYLSIIVESIYDILYRILFTPESNRMIKQNVLKSTVHTAALALLIQAGATTQAAAQAGVFEVIHPETEKGEVEIEVLNGIGLSDVDDGEERSEHEFAIGYGITDSWKLTFAVEVANPSDESAEVEGFEIESLLLLPFGGGGHNEKEDKESDEHDHGHGHGHGHDDHGAFTFGIFAAVEIPEEGGLSDGAVEIGPVFEAGLGSWNWVGNALVEIPLEDDADAGLVYASQLVYPVNDVFGVGFEIFGEFEELFGGEDEQEHVAGPAFYLGYELPNGHALEPRAAVLFGLNDDSPDAVLSINIEYKFDL